MASILNLKRHTWLTPDYESLISAFECGLDWTAIANKKSIFIADI